MDTEPAYPKLIGPYRISGRLGAGGMGEVLRGFDDRLDRPVALKRVLQDARDPDKARRRFQREARAASRLSHPAIVQVYDWVENAGGDWLVMELAPGRPLDELIAEGPLSAKRARAIAREVASGLEVAHEAGLVHRDLKPANVIVTTNGGAKILDFGLAKWVGTKSAGTERGREDKDQVKTTLTEEGQVVGTVSAMSPEQALGRPVDHRSDLFSLGTMLYEMLSGVSPFEGDSAVETLTRICTAKEEPLRQLDPDIPRDLSRLVERLLEKEPVRRPPSARQVVAELDRWHGGPAESMGGIEEWTPSSQEVTLVGEPLVDGTLVDGTLVDGTLVDGTLVDRAVAVVDSDPSVIPKTSRRWWVMLVTVGVLIGFGLWSLFSWQRLSAEKTPNGKPAVGNSVAASSHAFFQRGMTYLERYDRKGNIDKAIADFQRALAEDEDSAPFLAGLARAYWFDFYSGSKDRQRLEQALAAAQRAVGLDEYLAIARVSLGMAYFELGRSDEALRELEHALQLEPLNADAHYGLALVYDSRGGFKEAEKQIHKAIEARPEAWHYPAWLGMNYAKRGRYEEAETAFRQSLELAPDNLLALRNLGVHYYTQGKLAEAASQFQRALQIQPDASVYANLGTLYFVQGLYPQSVSAFEKAVGTGAGANDYFLWGNLGDAYRWTPDNELQAREAYLRASQLLREKLAALPRDITLRTRLLLYLAKRDDCDQSMAEIATLADLPGTDANSWFRITVANEICDQRGAALTALELALQAGFSITEVRRDPELLKLRQDVRYHRLTMNLQPPGEG